ncbi:MAG TPA: FliM/FliN family flagellar motor switch protein [Pseudoduganella sp.]
MSSHASGQAATVELAERVELAELRNHGGAPLALGQGALLQGVQVGLSVQVGQAQASLAQLMELQSGAVFTLDRAVDAPLDLLVNGQLVGRGELVVVGDQFGVRVTEVAPRSHG